MLWNDIFVESAVVMLKIDHNASRSEMRSIKRFASVRQPVWDLFYRVHDLSYSWSIQIWNKGELAYRVGIVGHLHCHTCLNVSVGNSFYNTRAPILEEHIPS